MGWADTVATTLTSRDVGLAMSLTLVKELGYLCSAVGNRSVFRAELLAVVRALEECQPLRVVSDCKSQAIQSSQRQPKG
eukprot:3065095-Amphidinium_carterae.2